MIEVSPGIFRGNRNYNMADFKTVLNLESGVFAFLNGKLNAELVRAWQLDIEYLNYELIPIWPPSIEDLFHIANIIDEAPKPIYVHCKDGVDRTGMVIAAYRMLFEGWSYEQAKEEMFAMGFHRYRYFWWPKRLKELHA